MVLLIASVNTEVATDEHIALPILPLIPTYGLFVYRTQKGKKATLKGDQKVRMSHAESKKLL
jgi:hypothetical protein